MCETTEIRIEDRSQILSLAGEDDRGRIAVGDCEGQLRIYTATALGRDGLRLDTSLKLGYAATALRWRHEDDLVAVGGSSGVVAIVGWQGRWTELGSLQAHKGDVLDLCWFGVQLISGSVDNHVGVFHFSSSPLPQLTLTCLINSDLGWVTGFAVQFGHLYVQVVSPQNATGHISVFQPQTQCLRSVLGFEHDLDTDSCETLVCRPVSVADFLCFPMRGTDPDLKYGSLWCFWPAENRILELHFPEEFEFATCVAAIGQWVFVGTNRGVRVAKAGFFMKWEDQLWLDEHDSVVVSYTQSIAEYAAGVIVATNSGRLYALTPPSLQHIQSPYIAY